MKFSAIAMFLAATFALARAQEETDKKIERLQQREQRQALRKVEREERQASRKNNNSRKIKGEKTEEKKEEKPKKDGNEEKVPKASKASKGSKGSKKSKKGEGGAASKPKKEPKGKKEQKEEKGNESYCATVAELNQVIAEAADAVPQISKSYFDAGGGKAGKAKTEACEAAYNTAVATIDSLYDFEAGTPEQGQNYDLRTTRNGFLSYLLGTECLTMVGEPSDQFPSGNFDGTIFQEYGFALQNVKKNRGWTGSPIWNENNFDYDLNCGTPGAIGDIEFESVTDGNPIKTKNSYEFGYVRNGRVAIISQQISSDGVLAGISCTDNCENLFADEI